MGTVSNSISGNAPRAYAVILCAGLLAGALDITSAFATSGFHVVRILQAIASGLLGAQSFRGGTATAVLGLVLHFIIAIVAAALYYLASRKLRALVEQPFRWGSLYGVAVWLFMNLIVLPLSAIPFKTSFPLDRVALGLLIHILLIGLPIALVVRHFSMEEAR
ncbi:MAG: hypothetical protein J2P41_17510 [Blastocatellia bacterium]|nr:hypothetical protein [Blastocatellia bacterium]